MKIRELLNENSMNDLKSFIDDLLITTKANRVSEVSMDRIIQTLRANGFNITPELLISLLGTNPNVQMADKTKVVINSDMPYSQDEEEVDSSEDDVSKMALDTAKKDIK